MKRTVLIVLGCIGFAATSALAGPPPTPGVAQPGSYNCYKAKDLKVGLFQGTAEPAIG